MCGWGSSIHGKASYTSVATVVVSQPCGSIGSATDNVKAQRVSQQQVGCEPALALLTGVCASPRWWRIITRCASRVPPDRVYRATRSGLDQRWRPGVLGEAVPDWYLAISLLSIVPGLSSELRRPLTYIPFRAWTCLLTSNPNHHYQSHETHYVWQ